MPAARFAEADLTAFILADRSDPLTEVLGRPFVFHILDAIVALAPREVVICGPGPVVRALRSAVGASYRDMNMRYSQRPTRPGDAGALPLAQSSPPSPLALVLAGDALPTADLRDFVRRGLEAGGPATLLLSEDADAARFGVKIDASGRVTGIGGDGPEAIGACLLRPGVLDSAAPGGTASLAGEVFPRLAAAGDLRGMRIAGRTVRVGTPESNAAAGRLLAGLPEDGAPRPAVFLDRDGTVIEERDYLSDPAGVALLPGATEGLARLRDLGLPLVLVTNQSGVGRGYFGGDAVERVHGRLIDLLAGHGVRLSAIYSCPHAPGDGCACRKPLPGLLHRAADELNLDLARSFVIGDKPCDIQLGLAVGATTVLVRTGYGAGHARAGDCSPEFVTADLAEAAARIADRLRDAQH